MFEFIQVIEALLDFILKPSAALLTFHTQKEMKQNKTKTKTVVVEATGEMMSDYQLLLDAALNNCTR